MKKFIAEKLRRFADWLYPLRGSVEIVGDYVARDCAIATGFGKKDIKEVKSAYNLSSKQAIRSLIRNSLGQNRVDIMNTLRENEIFEERVYRLNGQTVVETRLKIYVPKGKKDKG